MGNSQRYCSCNDIINNIFYDVDSHVDMSKLENPNKETIYDKNKIIKIQSSFRRYLSNKSFTRSTFNTKTKKVDESIDNSNNQFPTQSTKSKKDRKKKKKQRVIEDSPSKETVASGYNKKDDTTKNITTTINENDELTPDIKINSQLYENPFNKDNCPCKEIPSFDDIVLSEKVAQTEATLSEFIIEEKELLKYFESYPFKLKHFTMEYQNGVKYNGYYGPEWTKEGFGILIHKDGSKYEGMFKSDLAEGRGRLILAKGDYYEGEFSDDKANGYGKYVSIEGEIYIGYWANDKQHGKGELLLKDGSRYEGFFQFGLKSGKGKLSWPDTSFYEGNFDNNCYQGYGVYYNRNGKIYKGEWNKGQMEGVGIFIWPDGKKYIGYYHQDKKNGYGVYIGKNGKKYEGKFYHGKQHGIGRIVDEKNISQLGLYQKGKMIKCLNEKDFKEDIERINKEIEKINNIINTVDFFKRDDGNKLKTGFTVESYSKD